MGGKPQRDGTIFMGEVEHSRHYVHLAIVGALGWIKWLKMGQTNVYISCSYSNTISLLVKILLIKLKYLYIQYAGISIMKKQNSIQNGKAKKMVVLVKTFDHYYHKFQLFQLPCKIVKEFETEIWIEI